MLKKKITRRFFLKDISFVFIVSFVFYNLNKIFINKKRKEIYTRVLKGHIAVNNFNLKKNTLGSHIDHVARKYLREIGLDYDHGTGHGVGHFLNVHENPPNISKFSKCKFFEGQLMSNEPGLFCGVQP